MTTTTTYSREAAGAWRRMYEELGLRVVVTHVPARGLVPALWCLRAERRQHRSLWPKVTKKI